MQRKPNILVLCVALAAFVAASYAWNDRLASQRDDRSGTRDFVFAVVKLEEAIGYGGFIHHFKNAVLRPNEPYYLDAARLSFARADAAMQAISASQQGQEFLSTLQPVRETLDEYAAKLDVVEQMAAAGATSAQIDAAVRISDDAALLGLREFLDGQRAILHRQYTSLNQLTAWMFWLIVALVLLALVAGALGFARFKEVAQQAERDKIYASEMRHRSNNILSVFQAMNRMTAQSTSTAKEHADKLSGQIQAIAKAQAMSAERPGGAIPFDHLLKTLSKGYLDGSGAKFEVSGDNFLVQAKRAQSLALIVNELFVNSVRHGALGAQDGLVHVSVTADPDTPDNLRVLWNESGGPAPQPQNDPGLGTQLISRITELDLKGTCTLSFPSAGARIEISFPKTDVTVTSDWATQTVVPKLKQAF